MYQSHFTHSRDKKVRHSMTIGVLNRSPMRNLWWLRHSATDFRAAIAMCSHEPSEPPPPSIIGSDSDSEEHREGAHVWLVPLMLSLFPDAARRLENFKEA